MLASFNNLHEAKIMTNSAENPAKVAKMTQELQFDNIMTIA